MKRNKLLLLIACLIVFFIGFIITIESIKIEEIINTNLSTLLTKKESKYEVYLKDNSAIEEKVLEMNKSYVAKLVDKIKFDYNFTYSGNSELEYTVNAYLTVEYQNTNIVTSPTIMKKEYNIIPTTKVKNEGEKTTISETINLDYPYYNKELQRIENVISVPVKAYVDLIFKIKDNFTGMIYNTTYTIPLAQEVFNVTNKSNMKTEKTSETEVKVNEVSCIIGVALILSSIVIFIKNLDHKKEKTERETYYTIKLNRILQSYGDIVVEMIDPIDLEGLQVRNVKNFEQLVDIEVEIRKPIVFYETIPKKEGEFIIIQDDIAYRYILKNIKSNYKYRRKI